MSGDDRIRDAFDDLSRRANTLDPHAALRRTTRARTRPRGEWRWALAAAAAVFVVVGAVVVLELLPGDGDIPLVSEPSTTTTTEEPASTTTTEFVETTTTVIAGDDLPVTAADMAPCEGEPVYAGERADTTMAVEALHSGEVADGCRRIVVGFAGDGGSTAVPWWYEAQSPWPLVVELPDTTAVAPEATDADGAYVVRRPDRSLALVVLVPADEVLVRSIPERGMLVIDLTEGDRPVLPSLGTVALTRPVQANAGTVEVTGIARPFEANLGVHVEDAGRGGTEGEPVEAVFSGSSFFGTVRTDAYAVQTDDWLEAWAPFAVRVDGLPAGEYVLVLDAEGGADQPRTLRISFTLDEGGDAAPPSDAANRVATALLGFARGGPLPAIADTVTLRLGNQVSEVRTADELADPSGWIVDAEVFNGYGGPFDILEPLRRDPFVRVTEGAIPHCAAPVVDWWPSEDPAQVNVEPIGTDSCIEWYAVTMRVEPDGLISEVVLDLWEP